MGSVSSASLWITVAVSLGLFWLPAVALFIAFVWREMARLRRDREALKREAESLRDEGYPPGPPHPPPPILPPSR